MYIKLLLCTQQQGKVSGLIMLHHLNKVNYNGTDIQTAHLKNLDVDVEEYVTHYPHFHMIKTL